jgi:polar amino acid transport system ATP-binding protein/sulfate transport system ATP-binding protein
MTKTDHVLLHVENVSQKLGGNQILEGLTFEVRDRVRPDAVTGQVVGMLGPSGVGKTRLLRIISGLDQPDTGQVLGPDGKPLPVGTVGVVFQNYLLLRHRTVLGNLLAAGSAGGMSRADSMKRSAELLQRFGLLDRGKFYPAQLSGGQRQRVAIAQQLVHQKRLLIMDEPFSGLDPHALDNVIELLFEVAHQHEHNTLIVITHDIRAAMMLCDTLLLLGRARDAEGNVISGAHIVEEIDLAEHGLAWRENVELDPKFVELEREIKAKFAKL